MPDSDSLVLLIAAFVGACFGSFVTLASYRLPRGEDVVRTPSRCPHCGTVLRALDLVPVFSWWLRRGACTHCNAKIGWRYPAIELATATLFTLNVLRFGAGAEALLYCLLAVALMILIVTDFEHYIIPDEAQIALALLAVPYVYINKIELSEPFVGCLLGLFTGYALHYGYRWFRKKDALGLGDVKLMAVSGLWLGPLGLIPLFFYAGLLGILVAVAWRTAGRGARFPFGPAIAGALYLLTVFPESGLWFWSALTAQIHDAYPLSP